MFAFTLTGLAPWEVVAFSALCAVSALSVATSVAMTVAYLATRAPRAARHPVPTRAPKAQSQLTGPTPPVVAMGHAAG